MKINIGRLKQWLSNNEAYNKAETKLIIEALKEYKDERRAA